MAFMLLLQLILLMKLEMKSKWQIKVVFRLTVAMSPRLTRRVSGHKSIGMNLPDLSMTSRPPTSSSSCRMVRKPESVCISRPREPTLSWVKWYLFILNSHSQFSNPIFLLSTLKLWDSFSTISRKRSCTALTYLKIISLLQK